MPNASFAQHKGILAKLALGAAFKPWLWVRDGEALKPQP
jgi:hypothetical protein